MPSMARACSSGAVRSLMIAMACSWHLLPFVNVGTAPRQATGGEPIFRRDEQPGDQRRSGEMVSVDHSVPAGRAGRANLVRPVHQGGAPRRDQPEQPASEAEHFVRQRQLLLYKPRMPGSPISTDPDRQSMERRT